MTPFSVGPDTLKKSDLAFCQFTRVKQALALLSITIGLTFFGGCSITRDQEEARAVAAQVHKEMLEGNFAAIYNESAPPFKAVGSESEFVSGLKNFQERFGPLKNENEIAYQTTLDPSIGRTHVLLFDLEFDRGRARETLMLVRSASGKMELWRLDIQPFD